jgi:hypothetical protein
MTDILNDPESYVVGAKIEMSEVRRSASKHIYIINTSDFDGTEQRGEVSLKFLSDTGTTERYRIPDTWIPHDITQYQEKDKWVRDTGLNRLISSGYLTIVDPDVAEAVLEHEDAKQEINRLREKERKLAPHVAKARQQANRSASEAREKYKAVDDVKRVSLQAAEEGMKVSPRVMTIMTNKSTDEQQKLAALKNARGTLTAGDINYIMTNCGKDNPRIKAWTIELKNKG